MITKLWIAWAILGLTGILAGALEGFAWAMAFVIPAALCGWAAFFLRP
jgi:hypothetical protein